MLNADDPLVAENGLISDRQICWFSLDPRNSYLMNGKENGDPCCWLDGKIINYCADSKVDFQIDVGGIPITMDGAAKFNIQNAMGAISLAKAMGIGNDAIAKGLTEFTATPDDNPGRCNEFAVKGARVFVDFAHNPHAIAAMSQMLENLPARRKYVLLCHAGDRSDQEIKDLTKGAIGFGPDLVVTSELEEYLRGREWGDIPALIAEQCLGKRYRVEAVKHTASPVEGMALILDRLGEEDVALILALSDRDQVFELIRAAQI